MTSQVMRSLAEELALADAATRARVLDGLSADQLRHLLTYWPFLRRPDQALPPGNWRTTLALAGRGWGKSRFGAESVIECIRDLGYKRVGLVGRTTADVRDVMVDGPSGIMAVSPPDFRPKYFPSKRLLVWPNGAKALTFSADKPDQMRGPQYDLVWGDEAAAWRTRDAWDQLSFGLRIPHPMGARAILTTTPRPKVWLREIMRDPGTVTIRGRTMDNAANLDPRQVRQLLVRYKGTTIGRQELDGELFDEAPGALWKRTMLDEKRRQDVVPLSLRERWALSMAVDDELRDKTAAAVLSNLQLSRIVVAVDPATSAEEGSDETGVVVMGADAQNHLWLLDDVSDRYTPNGWAMAAQKSFLRWKADRIVTEKNQGGDMVESTLRGVDRNLPISLVHASRGKAIRAEPVASAYEQGRGHHIRVFMDLEDQLCGWEPGDADSPDRLDALVWAGTELLGQGPVLYRPTPSLDVERWQDADSR